MPIKSYLLNRNDTIRCIISLLTDDSENYSKLTRELVKIPSKDQQAEMSSDEDENMAEKWEICSLVEKKKEPIRNHLGLLTTRNHFRLNFTLQKKKKNVYTQ